MSDLVVVVVKTREKGMVPQSHMISITMFTFFFSFLIIKSLSISFINMKNSAMACRTDEILVKHRDFSVVEIWLLSITAFYFSLVFPGSNSFAFFRFFFFQQPIELLNFICIRKRLPQVCKDAQVTSHGLYGWPMMPF